MKNAKSIISKTAQFFKSKLHGEGSGHFYFLLIINFFRALNTPV
jgi:hypothetical protein